MSRGRRLTKGPPNRSRHVAGQRMSKTLEGYPQFQLPLVCVVCRSRCRKHIIWSHRPARPLTLRQVALCTLPAVSGLSKTHNTVHRPPRPLTMCHVALCTLPAVSRMSRIVDNVIITSIRAYTCGFHGPPLPLSLRRNARCFHAALFPRTMRSSRKHVHAYASFEMADCSLHVSAGLKANLARCYRASEIVLSDAALCAVAIMIKRSTRRDRHSSRSLSKTHRGLASSRPPMGSSAEMALQMKRLDIGRMRLQLSHCKSKTIPSEGPVSG